MDTDWKRMRFPKEIVKTALGLYADGLSLRMVRRRIQRIYGVFIRSNQTVINWLLKFGKKSMQALRGPMEMKRRFAHGRKGCSSGSGRCDAKACSL